MAFVLADRVRETSLTTGTGELTLAGAQSGFKAFSAALATNDITFYAIVLGTQWETGIGTLTGATTLARTQVIESSNGNALVNFATGTKDVFITQSASYLRPATDTEVATGTDRYRPVGSKALATEFTRRRASLAEVNAGTATDRFVTPKELADTTLPLVHPNLQQFLGTSGTWTKPAGATYVLIECIQGGEGGDCAGGTTSAAGGDGGDYEWRLMLASDLPSSVPANVGGGRTKGGAAGGGISGAAGFAGGVSVEAGNGGAGVRGTTGEAGAAPGGGGGASNLTGGVGGAGGIRVRSW